MTDNGGGKVGEDHKSWRGGLVVEVESVVERNQYECSKFRVGEGALMNSEETVVWRL